MSVAGPVTRPAQDPFIGVVTASSPLRVRRDVPGSTAPNVTPMNTAGYLLPGEKVIVHVLGGQWCVMGVIGGRRWRTYSPGLRADTNPSGWSSTGKYRVADNSCEFEVNFIFPGSWSRGSGYYRIALPLVPVGYNDDERRMIHGEFYDGTAEIPLIGHIETGVAEINRISRLLSTGSYSKINDSAPATAAWRIYLSGSYRIAN